MVLNPAEIGRKVNYMLQWVTRNRLPAKGDAAFPWTVNAPLSLGTDLYTWWLCCKVYSRCSPKKLNLSEHYGQMFDSQRYSRASKQLKDDYDLYQEMIQKKGEARKEHQRLRRERAQTEARLRQDAEGERRRSEGKRRRARQDAERRVALGDLDLNHRGQKRKCGDFKHPTSKRGPKRPRKMRRPR